ERNEQRTARILVAAAAAGDPKRVEWRKPRRVRDRFAARTLVQSRSTRGYPQRNRARVDEIGTIVYRFARLSRYAHLSGLSARVAVESGDRGCPRYRSRQTDIG